MMFFFNITNIMIQSQIARFMGPIWGPPGSCRPQMAPVLAPWTLLSSQIASFVGPTWVLLAPDGPHVGPMNLAIWDGDSPANLTDIHCAPDTHQIISFLLNQPPNCDELHWFRIIRFMNGLYRNQKGFENINPFNPATQMIRLLSGISSAFYWTKLDATKPRPLL